MTIDQMIEVMQAYKDGKRVEMRGRYAHPDSKWTDSTVPAPTWDFPNYKYRIKPEPKEFLVVVDKNGQVVGGCNNNFRPGQVLVYRHDGKLSDVTVVKVREVL